MKKPNKYAAVYSDMLEVMSEIIFHQGLSQRQIYRGAKAYGALLVNEYFRYEDVKNSHAGAIERLGLVCPKAVLKFWAFDLLEGCRLSKIVTPYEAIEPTYYLMGCKEIHSETGKLNKRANYRKLQQSNPGIGVREAAREIGVNEATIHRWKTDASIGKAMACNDGIDDWSALHSEVRIRMSIDTYYDYIHNSVHNLR